MKKQSSKSKNPGLEGEGDDVLIKIINAQSRVIESLSQAVTAMASATEFADDDDEDDDEEEGEESEDEEGSKG